MMSASTSEAALQDWSSLYGEYVIAHNPSFGTKVLLPPVGVGVADVVEVEVADDLVEVGSADLTGSAGFVVPAGEVGATGTTVPVEDRKSVV